MFLLDTNVVSELRKAGTNRVDENVVRWATGQSVSRLFLSSISILELEMGILQKELKDVKQAAVLKKPMGSYMDTQNKTSVV